MNDLRNDPTILELVERLKSVFDPCTIYLFGSQVQGSTQKDSDFDVMVVIPHSDETHYQRAKRSYTALMGFGHPVDVLVYTQEEWDFGSSRRYSIAREIKDTGVCLYAA